MAGIKVADAASAMPPPKVAGDQADSSVPVWMFVLLGSATLAGVALVIWYRARMDGAALAPALEASRGPFCFRCGTPLKGAARFCHSCGAAARVVAEWGLKYEASNMRSQIQDLKHAASNVTDGDEPSKGDRRLDQVLSYSE
jgi:hypothetical protein